MVPSGLAELENTSLWHNQKQSVKIWYNPVRTRWFSRWGCSIPFSLCYLKVKCSPPDTGGQHRTVVRILMYSGYLCTRMSQILVRHRKRKRGSDSGSTGIILNYLPGPSSVERGEEGDGHSGKAKSVWGEESWEGDGFVLIHRRVSAALK